MMCLALIILWTMQKKPTLNCSIHILSIWSPFNSMILHIGQMMTLLSTIKLDLILIPSSYQEKVYMKLFWSQRMKIQRWEIHWGTRSLSRKITRFLTIGWVWCWADHTKLTSNNGISVDIRKMVVLLIKSWTLLIWVTEPAHCFHWSIWLIIDSLWRLTTLIW